MERMHANNKYIWKKIAEEEEEEIYTTIAVLLQWIQYTYLCVSLNEHDSAYM